MHALTVQELADEKHWTKIELEHDWGEALTEDMQSHRPSRRARAWAAAQRRARIKAQQPEINFEAL